MSEDSPEPTAISNPNRWAVQLIVAAVAIAAMTGVLFYFTTRGVFGRADGGGAEARVDPARAVVSLQHGLTVYAQNCAACHGPAGLGDGPPGAALNPKPRNFSTGWFKMGSTRSGLPTDDDLATTIRRGMLPAPMPPWPQLTDGEVRSVAMAVRHLAIEGRAAERLARAPSTGREKAVRDAHAQLDPGPAIALPPKPAAIDVKRGEQFYLANCAACHDPDGRGKLRDDLVDNEENPIAARDLTSGQFKGGNAIEDIAMRVVRGLPGSPMPGNPDIAAEDLWSVAAHVRQMFDRPAATTTATAP